MINFLENIKSYHELYPLDRQLVYLSGKWFILGTKEEIKDTLQYILKSDIYLDISQRALFLGNVRNINDILDWLENYKIYPFEYNDKFGSWYPLKLTREVLSVSKDDYTTTTLKCSEVVKNLPYKLFKKEIYIINRLLFHPEDEIIYLIYGVGGSGKSTFLNIIKQMFENDVAPCSIDDLSNDFQLAEACKHRLICSDEINTSNFNNGKLKILASKQLVNLNPKNKTPYDIKSQSALIFATNKVPYLDISDTGIIRRILFYSKNKKIEKPDSRFQNYKFSHEELFSLAFTSYIMESSEWRLLFQKETHELLMKNNSVFLAQTNDYEVYKNFCYKKGYKPFSENNFFDIKMIFDEWEKEDEFLY